MNKCASRTSDRKGGGYMIVILSSVGEKMCPVINLVSCMDDLARQCFYNVGVPVISNLLNVTCITLRILFDF